MQTSGGWLALMVAGMAWWMLTRHWDDSASSGRQQDAHSVSPRILLMLVVAGLSVLWLTQAQASTDSATWFRGALWIAGGAGGLWLISQTERIPPR